MSFETTKTQGNSWPQDTAGHGSTTTQSRVETLKNDVGGALDRGRTGIADSAQAAGENLNSDIAKLRADMASIQQTLTQFASQAGGEAYKTAQNVGNVVASQIGDVATEVATVTKEQAKTFASELETMARKNPLGTIGVTLLAGVIIGMITRGGRS
jgi:ElaB/YqjD/DUF883 family membrane-anchored ribosome-binding protein